MGRREHKQRFWEAIARGLSSEEAGAAAGVSPVDDLTGAAPQRGDARGRLEYRATTAQWHADRRVRRPKPTKLATNDALRN